MSKKSVEHRLTFNTAIIHIYVYHACRIALGCVIPSTAKASDGVWQGKASAGEGVELGLRGWGGTERGVSNLPTKSLRSGSQIAHYGTKSLRKRTIGQAASGRSFVTY